MEVTSYPHGTFCFAELNTSDMDGARRFYGELLGWTAFDVPSAQGGYALLRRGGKDVAGLHRIAPGRSAWVSYVNVDDTDRVAARAKELGAVERAAPFDVPTVGRMAMLQDPCGAHLALWQTLGYAGAAIVGEPGAMCWNELLVRDMDAARRFYPALFGWTLHETRVPNGPYTICKLGEKQVGAMMPIQKEWGDVAPHWLVYFAVEDCEAACAVSRRLGREAIGPMDVPGVGRFAIMEDPAGASFAIFQGVEP